MSTEVNDESAWREKVVPIERRRRRQTTVFALYYYDQKLWQEIRRSPRRPHLHIKRTLEEANSCETAHAWRKRHQKPMGPIKRTPCQTLLSICLAKPEIIKIVLKTKISDTNFKFIFRTGDVRKKCAKQDFRHISAPPCIYWPSMRAPAITGQYPRREGRRSIDRRRE